MWIQKILETGDFGNGIPFSKKERLYVSDIVEVKYPDEKGTVVVIGEICP